MPSNNPIPAKCFHVMPSAIDAKPNLTNKKGKVKMPINLPATKPTMMPNEFSS